MGEAGARPVTPRGPAGNAADHRDEAQPHSPVAGSRLHLRRRDQLNFKIGCGYGNLPVFHDKQHVRKDWHSLPTLNNTNYGL